MNTKHALLINYTANSYHWGCYGTSVEIFRTLTEKGYLVETVGVADIAELNLYNFNHEGIEDGKLFIKILQKNERLFRLVMATDLIIVNGEGSIHGFGKAPLNLLYLIFILKNYLNKKVHLINSAIFPNSIPDAALDQNSAKLVDSLYQTTLKGLDLIVPRDQKSALNLQGLNLSFVQGFDCLPRFIARQNLVNSASRNHGYLISGGIALSKKQIKILAELLKPKIDLSKPIYFLSGAKSLPVDSDKTQFEQLREHLPQIEWLYANSMQEWLVYIARAECLISGRFHHTMAAATLGTPFLALSSNTPKIQAALEMLDLSDSLIELGAETGDDHADYAISTLLHHPSVVRIEKIQEVIELAANNFNAI
ncbi:polysaccharide pyruvyl transferase family protein [Polynucleobacter paneuropaeus]|jgi:polysaccharide pyruvyl transferase WcaK-like protein|nr:polysaccharide pyruvyl transferase family protein [Polynucleobacter paneuropaeus]